MVLYIGGVEYMCKKFWGEREFKAEAARIIYQISRTFSLHKVHMHVNYARDEM